MLKKKKTFIISAIIILCLTGSVFFILNSSKNKSINILAEKINSHENNIRKQAEDEILNIGKPAIEPLKKILKNKLFLLKYHNIFENLMTLISTKNKISLKKGDNFALIQHITRLQNLLSKLGDRSAVDESTVNTVLDYVDNNHISKGEAGELGLFFRSAGKASIRPIMEHYRGCKSYKEYKKYKKQSLFKLFLFYAIDENSIDILVNYLKDKDVGVRVLAADLLGYTEEHPSDYFLSFYRPKWERTMILKEELFFRKYKPKYSEPLDLIFAYKHLCYQVGNKDSKFKKPYSDPREMIRNSRESFKNTKAVEPLIESLNDPSDDVKFTAIQSLGLIGDKRAEETILKFLIKRKLTGKGLLLVCSSLQSVGGDKSAKTLIDYTKSSFKAGNIDTYTLCRIFRTLGIIGSREASPFLLDILNDKYRKDIHNFITVKSDFKQCNNCIQTRAIVALGLIGEEKAVEPLIKILKQQDFERGDLYEGTGNVAAFSLGLIGDKRALKPLKESLNDSKGEISIIKWAIWEIEKNNREVPAGRRRSQAN